jgi:hypothetical protein
MVKLLNRPTTAPPIAAIRKRAELAMDGLTGLYIASAASSRSYRWMQAASTSPIPSSPADAAVSSPNNDGTGVSGIKTFFITAAILCLLWVFGVAFAILLDGA